MKTGRQEKSGRIRNSFRFVFTLRVGSILLILLGCFVSVAQEHPLEVLRTADQVRRLTPEQAALHYPVRLRALVTIFDQSLFYRFINDGTAGIYLGDPGNLPPLISGQIVEVEGLTNPGEYAPIIMPQRIVVQGEGTNWPDAKPASFEQLASGQEDSQFVEIHGIVRSASVDTTKHQIIEIATGGGRLEAFAKDLPVERLEDLVDSTVRVRGICVTLFNKQRQLFQLRLLVPRPQDLVVEKPAPKEPFNVPKQSIRSLLQFTPEVPYGHRVKVAGTVIYRQADRTLYIQDKEDGLYVQTRQPGSLLVGEQVEVLGFPAKGEYTPMLEDAVYRRVASGPLPDPDRITANEALKGIYDCRLVRIEATLLDRARHSREQFVVLQAGGFIFHAYMEGKEGGTGFAYLQNGSKVAVTGVCLIETGNDWHAGEDWRAKSFRILLRSPGDIFVLAYPPWWTLQKLLWMMVVLGLIVLGAFTWVAVLRRRVQEQTKIISQKLQVEATLKERYVDLFENANDMVYTHDLAGRITSINQAGERLLQRSRDEILSRNIVELVVEEQRAAARQWLDQVLKGAGPPTVEWDFSAASAHRVKLEISTRLIESGGQLIEVEGIARDISERKRLEREILEISNREQRRIGHDLHDGVCQQLAGIAYMTASLADLLEEKGAVESSQAERISGLINAAINQTRGVARGLFPVRLEENGLVSALEELAANASELFKMQCRFSCDQPPGEVENEIGLHLYYIVLEAVANAAKHGKARNITITLEPAGDRYSLSVRDDGTGFLHSGSHHTGMGIRIMHYRARVIGATLSLQSRPGSGTHLVCLFLPVSHELLQTTENNGKPA
ncbi:MAG: sensor signal transduction histidine kinase [Pedosphaera sp.]|nr:sensor signal transduction histidine kinase [Pedosphaera sp.]